MMKNVPVQPWLKMAKTNINELFEGNKKFIFQFTAADPSVFTGLDGLANTKNNICRSVRDHKYDIEIQLNNLNRRYEMGFEDDFLYSLHPYTGIGLVASGFGCITEFPENGDPVTHPVIKSVEDISNIQFNIGRADLVNITLDKIKYFQDQTQGQIPISLPDMQSPINVASILWDYTDFLCAMIECPEKVHDVLKRITDAMIEVLNKIDEINPNGFHSAGWALPRGIWLSDDLMAVISPEQYEEFAMPYANILSKKYGGIFLHSCGNPLRSIDKIRNYKNFMGLDFWEVTIKDFQNAGGDYMCSCPVAKDRWHNLDRRAMRTTPTQAAEDAMNDLENLKNCLESPILFYAVCPHPDYCDEYHHKLLEISSMANT